jgi:DNA-binding MarR family transcriptional regulator
VTDIETAASDRFNALALSVFDVNTALNLAGDALTRPVGQSSARWRVLGRAAHAPQTVSQIAGRIGHARQSVQRVADDLVDAGLAEYLPAPGDRRTQLVQLTDRGFTALATIETEQARWTARLTAALGEHDLSKLTSQLRSVHSAIMADYRDTYDAS